MRTEELLDRVVHLQCTSLLWRLLHVVQLELRTMRRYAKPQSGLKVVLSCSAVRGSAKALMLQATAGVGFIQLSTHPEL